MTGEIIYQIFPDRFYNGNKENDPPNTRPWGGPIDSECFMGGDIEGIIQKLDYLSWLGITAIYLNPIFLSPTNHKYNVTDYYKIDSSLGNPDDFKRLIRECHSRGIAVIIDGVFNHTGTEFFAFRDILVNQEKSRYKDWYDIYGFPVVVKDPPNYKACGGVSYLPKLNTANPEVQNYIIDVIKYWEGFGIDGIRLDVAFEIDPSLLKKIRESTKLFLIGEVWGCGGRFVPEYFNGLTNYLLRDLIIKAVVNQCIDSLMFRDEWELIAGMYGDNINCMINLAGSHDTARIYTLCKGDIRKVNLVFALLFLLPGIPMIYYGDEIGMEGENDPYCRGAMIWDSSLWHREIQDNIRYLIGLRKRFPSLEYGKIRFTNCIDRAMSFERVYGDEKIKLVVNFGFQPISIDSYKLDELSFKIIT
ncbi:MAG: glycoside hydrolase family 13 protein [Thermoanaerobacteraceae bacterium]|nr:glycoside hydrolase family 13 protein [Thermoanaerobacteraceae bacterium]